MIALSLVGVDLLQMVRTIAFGVACAVTLCLSLSAATVTYSNVLPQQALPNYVRTDGAGYIYVAGTTPIGPGGVFVAKLSSDASRVIYFTSIGGPLVGGQIDILQAFAVAPDGSVYAAISYVGQIGSLIASSITKLDPSGEIVSIPPATAPDSFYGYIQGFAPSVQDMTVDLAGNLYLTGEPGPLNFQASSGALNNPSGSGFILKTEATMTKLQWLVAGYSGAHIAVDGNQNVYVVGTTTLSVPTSIGALQTNYPTASPNRNCGVINNMVITDQPVSCAHQYVAAIDQSGSKLIYSTYLTGTFADVPAGIAVDSSGIAYVAGSTHSFDFPTTLNALQTTYAAQVPNPNFPGETFPAPIPGIMPPTDVLVSATGYIAALNSSGTALVFSTFFGGSDTDLISGISLDSGAGAISVTGVATSPDLPAIDGAYRQCVPQSFIGRVSLDGSAVKRTVLVPLTLTAFTILPNGSAFFVNPTQIGTVDFAAPDPVIACLANSPDLFITNTVSPGQLLTIFGNQLGAAAQSLSPSSGSYPTTAGAVQIQIGGVPAPLLYVSPGQINLQVPYEISGSTQAILQLTATNVENFAASESLPLSVVQSTVAALQVPVAPGECPGSYFGQTKTLVINADGTVNSCYNPARANSIVKLFVDGLGTVSGAGATGSVNPANSTQTPLSVTVTSTDGILSSSGSAQSFAGAISGLYQVNLTIPSASAPYLLQENLRIGSAYSENPIAINVAP